MEYTCAYCGNTYKTIEERTHCEEMCHNKQFLESKKNEATKRKEEMKRDYDEISSLEDELDKLEKKLRDKRTKFDEKYDSLGDSNFYTLLNSAFRNPFWAVGF